MGTKEPFAHPHSFTSLLLTSPVTSYYCHKQGKAVESITTK